MVGWANYLSRYILLFFNTGSWLNGTISDWLSEDPGSIPGESILV